MFLIREVINCKPGKVGELIKKFRAVSQVMEEIGLKPFRLMTDVSGEPFWTVVAETEAESVDAFFDAVGQIMANERAREIMTGYHDLVVKGRREILRIEA